MVLISDNYYTLDIVLLLTAGGFQLSRQQFLGQYTVPFRIVRQSRVTDPPDGAEIGCLSRVTLALAGCDKEVQKK